MDERFNSIEVPAEIDLTIETAIKEGRKKRKINKLKPYVATAACFCIMVTGFAVYKNMDNSKVNSDKNIEVGIIKTDKLPTVGTYKNLNVLLKDYIKNSNVKLDEIKGGALYDGITNGRTSSSTGKTLRDGAQQQKSGSSVNSTKDTVNISADYSETNQQVKGVDEGDIVKTDGKFIYRITGNKLVIVNSVPAEKLSLEATINYSNGFTPNEMFVKGKYLTVIGNYVSSEPPKTISDDLIYINNQQTKVYIYDISDKKKPAQIREIELDGSYTQSRLIDSTVYVISNKNIPLYKDELYNELPICKDSVLSNKEIKVDYSSINYCPNALEPNYIIIGCINLDKINDQINISTVLGSGENIYVSENNIYIAGSNYTGDASKEGKTSIYKFSLNKDSTKYVTSGVVKGTLLNQFSMDESKEYFRVVTTEGNNTKNNLYILNNDMKTGGAIEGLAPGERIYSARFMGDRAYMVTFKQTDPLFVIDLKNPEAPKVLGELKIPGFSNYLEPYDDNHIMGFGQDTVYVNEGGTIMAKPVGMKIAMYDVTDVSNPKEQFQTKVEGNNSYSSLLNNHKALLFSADKNLLAFPVSYANVNKPENIGGFQGAYVYNVDLVNGFVLKGKVTHKDMKTVGDNSEPYYFGSEIDRELYIGNILFTVSNGVIKANNLQDLKEVSRLVINPDYSQNSGGVMLK